MNIIFNTLTSAELAERITAKIDMRGVAGFDNWPTAEPVMLRDVILQALTLYEAQTKKTIAWMEPVTTEDPGLYITKNYYIMPAAVHESEPGEEVEGQPAAEQEPVDETEESAAEPEPTQETETDPAVTEHNDFVDALTYAMTAESHREPAETSAEEIAEDDEEEETVEAAPDDSELLFELKDICPDKDKADIVIEDFPGPDMETVADEPVESQETAHESQSKGRYLGKWAEYQGKALSRLEMKLITYGMLDEQYPMSVIASVIRVSPQTVCNWKNKREKEEAKVIEQNEKAKGRWREVGQDKEGE